MWEPIDAVVRSEEKNNLRQFLSELRASDARYLLRNDIERAFEQYCQKLKIDRGDYYTSNLGKFIFYTQEMILEEDSFCAIVRPKIGTQQVFRVWDDLKVEPMDVQELLDVRDRFVNRYNPQEGDVFEIDFKPFYDYSPKIKDPKNIGKGASFLSRYLSSNLFGQPERWLETLFQFLSIHSYQGMQLLLNQRIGSQRDLSDRVKQAIEFVAGLPGDRPYADFRFQLQELGFEPGWGNTAGKVRETLEILDDLLDSPDAQALNNFLARVPTIFHIVLVSVHGWFGQEGTLGRPDTGEQVVYVLDQAQSLEKRLQEEFREQGLDLLGVRPKVIILTRLIPNSNGTLCNQRLEKVHSTDNAWILRVPFRECNPKVTQNWISRFEIWPYLETYAIDAEKELLAEFQGRPDLIVGNYSDGSLVAFLLARRLKVIQCNIAHALEKTRHLFGNLYWQDLEDRYHFSLQFTADLIATNAANFILSNTYQEVAGSQESIGQYESYTCFTMPDLYHVVRGVELFSPKFNVVPPGVNESVYFPYTKRLERPEATIDRIAQVLFHVEEPDCIYGKLEDESKRPIFAMARPDRIQNLTGLVECFGGSEELQERANLILLAGTLRAEDARDEEEREEIEKMHQLVDRYNLHGKFRWLGLRLTKSESGEAYRAIADRQGVFVHPALFEAFGLNVLEAMISGLPTFVTLFGGSVEIVRDRDNGFYINPTDLQGMAATLVDFFDACDRDPQYWQDISQKAIERVYSAYTWQIHTQKLLSLAKIYGFWNYASTENREDMLRYIEALFYLIYKPRARELLEKHNAY